ncbi:PTS sugar transporter subunit IIA [Calditerrivibrio sp.]|uniref:PTS sugar transporter subunit IIA n=1 Tax=Calditerrivibrio sp. TaxID=2792612 RepID=UPI003D0D794D
MQKIFDDPKTILVIEEDFEKSQLIRKVVEYAHAINIIEDIEDTYNAVIKRESMCSTAIGDGVAIPHAKLPFVVGVNIIFCYLPNGVDFDAVDHNKVRYLFLILSQEKETTLHLKALAAISKLIKNTGFINQLNGEMEPMRIHSILKECWGQVL